jgi:hypothetical protein
MLLVTEPLAEFERVRIRERRRQGVALVRGRAHTYRERERPVSESAITEPQRLIGSGEKKSTAARD